MRVSIYFILFFFSCSIHSQNSAEKSYPAKKEKLQSFYLIGDLGEKSSEESPVSMEALNTFITSEENTRQEEDSFLLFLGDNSKDDLEFPGTTEPSELNDFSGNMVFVPGEKEWHSGGIDALKAVRNNLTDNLREENVILPTPGCAFSFVDISDDVHLIVVDSQWFLEDWDDHPLINDDCPEIKTP